MLIDLLPPQFYKKASDHGGVSVRSQILESIPLISHLIKQAMMANHLKRFFFSHTMRDNSMPRMGESNLSGPLYQSVLSAIKHRVYVIKNNKNRWIAAIGS